MRYISYDCIETLVQVYERYPNSQIVVGETRSFPTNYNYLLRKMRYPEYMDNHRIIKESLLRSNDILLMVTNTLYKNDFIKRHNLLFKDGIVHEDLHFTFYLAKYVHNMSISRKVTYYYRMNNTGGIMWSKIHEQQNSLDWIICDTFRNIDKKCVLSQFIYILHAAHLACIKRYGGSALPFIIRLFRTSWYLIKVLLDKNAYKRYL